MASTTSMTCQSTVNSAIGLTGPLVQSPGTFLPALISLSMTFLGAQSIEYIFPSGVGSQFRYKPVTKPAAHGGDPCVGSQYEEQTCYLMDCSMIFRWL